MDRLGYRLPRVSDPCGAVAQLGERLNGIQEVSGSIPLSSTKFALAKLPCEIPFA